MDRTASVASPVNQRLLAEKLAEVAAVSGSAGELLRAFEVFVRTAGDDALVRINAVQFAQQHGFATGEVVEMFLHARKLGLLTMEWQYDLVGKEGACRARVLSPTLV